MNFSDLILKSKRDSEQEYTLHLFEKCNLSCSFCWQDHKAMDGVATVREKLQPVKEFLDAEVKSKVTFNVMGGEIFDDAIFDDKLFDDYVYLSKEIFDYAASKGISARINFVSNLVTEQPGRIVKLMDTLKNLGVPNTLVTSYDSKGRFNKSQLMLFKRNVELLSGHISNVSMLLTKPVIRDLMTRNDPYFQYLYDAGFEIYFDYYTPTVENNQTKASDDKIEVQTVIAPSDLDLLRIFDFFIDNYPNVQPIKSWIEQKVNTLSCRQSKLVLSDGTKCLCGNLQLKEEKNIVFYKAKIKPDDNSEIEENFINRWDCTTCEYFERCQMGCFMQHDYTARGQMVECPFKLTYDKITKGIKIDFSSISTYFSK